MSEKIKMREKLAYGGTDFASNFVWTTVGSYLLFYYTNVLGLAAGVVGTLFLVTRILDAVIDPFVGVMIDKTNTRWGKSRPYFLWFSIPLGIMLALTFTTPHVSSSMKLVYAYVTYGVLGILYSLVNLPMTSILPRLAQEPKNRTILGAFRMCGAVIGGTLVSMLTLPLVHTFGAGDQVKGFQMTAIIYGGLAALFFLVAFANVRERVNQDVKQEKVPLKESLRAMKGNKPWLIMVFTIFLIFLITTLMQSSSIFYLTYKFGRQDLVPLLSMTGLLIFVAIILVPIISSKIGKRNSMILGYCVSIVGLLLIYPIGRNSIPLLFIGASISSIGTGLGSSLMFIMVADTVDYGEWKNGVRSEGILSAAASFGQKVGSALGGSVAAWILAFGHYNGKESIQPSSAIHAITVNYVIVPIALALLIIVLQIFNPIDKELPQMLADLKKRREENAA